jgi:hypothetical protein
MFDLRHPNKTFVDAAGPPLIERNPVLLWQAVSFVLACLVVVLVIRLFGLR